MGAPKSGESHAKGSLLKSRAPAASTVRGRVAIGLVVFVILLFTARNAQHWPALGNLYSTDPEVCSRHNGGYSSPACKIELALQHFNAKQARQSKTVQQARLAYQKRYGRKPPLRFDVWADFALQHKSPIIDDFDQVEVDMRPFRKAKLSRAAWQSRIGAAKASEPGEMLGLMSFVDGDVVALGPLVGTMSASTLESLLAPIAPLLPDMSILFNWFAEPRILAPIKKVGEPRNVSFEDFTGRSTMEALELSCPNENLCKNAEGGEKNVPVTRDLCSYIRKYGAEDVEQQHGFFRGPDQFHPTRSLIPLFSRAKMSVFNDILAPNVCYGHGDYRMWTENDTIPFTDKTKDIYWRGSMTGITQKRTDWMYGHRHQAVRYMQSLREFVTGQAEGEGPSSFASFFQQAPWTKEMERAAARLPASAWNVAFTGTICGNDKGLCDQIKKELSTRPRDKFGHAYEHQFVLDIDGQSMSCRLYSLLESNSVVFKQTLWGEWHDDRLVPWLHYVPIEVDLKRHDIPLYLDWFVNDAKGQRYAELISRESRKWSAKSLRSIDLTIYYFRLLIELEDIMSR
ncbi:hypothetical protein CBS101457_004995 [Exobasidium rhododendri]|nr:hypothetical protein CBS101457_004995 [Exobasidium rhododendri]